MTDDDNQDHTASAQRVHVHEDYELQYWTTHFGVTRERLKAAVAKVGVMVKDVETELKRR